MATERKRKARPTVEQWIEAAEAEATAAEMAEADLVTHVTLERGVGCASGFDRELPELRRFLEYQLARFLVARNLRGRWSLLAYVSRENKSGGDPK